MVKYLYLHISVFFPLQFSELAMLLSMAQSNPALFQMISDRKTVARQLEILSRLKELMDTTAEQLRAKQTEDWSCWIKKYRYRKFFRSDAFISHWHSFLMKVYCKALLFETKKT